VDDDRSTATITRGRKVVIHLIKVRLLHSNTSAMWSEGFPAQRSNKCCCC
jgi:hypothetical protein